MAAVLERELAAYQRALDDYNKDLAKHNRQVSAYNKSVVQDANGNVLVRLNDGTFMAAPKEGGKLVAANLPEGFGYETDRDATGYDAKRYTPVDSGSPGVSIMRTAGGAGLASPGDWDRTFAGQTPGITAAQARSLGRPSDVDVARGLIADVIQGNGINVGYNYMGAPAQGTATPMPGQKVLSASPITFDPWTPPPPPVNPVSDVNFAVPSGSTTPAYPTSTPGTPQFQQDLSTYLGNSYSQNASQAASAALATEQDRLNSGYYNMPAIPSSYTPPTYDYSAPVYTPPAPVYTPPAPVYTPPSYTFNYAPAGFDGFYFGY